MTALTTIVCWANKIYFIQNNSLFTRMHSSRIRTARFGGHNWLCLGVYTPSFTTPLDQPPPLTTPAFTTPQSRGKNPTQVHAGIHYLGQNDRQV